MKTQDAVEGFHLLKNSQTLPGFSTGYGGTESIFYFFYKIIIFIVDKEKNDILYEALIINSHNSETVKPLSCFIVL